MLETEFLLQVRAQTDCEAWARDRNGVWARDKAIRSGEWVAMMSGQLSAIPAQFLIEIRLDLLQVGDLFRQVVDHRQREGKVAGPGPGSFGFDRS